ncbi:MAG: hypothetical protein K2K35_10235 [Lachnospiraceae bacterium]|nr:hypothetical protein [Lachnospiraceae bacterium]
MPLLLPSLLLSSPLLLLFFFTSFPAASSSASQALMISSFDAIAALSNCALALASALANALQLSLV